MSIVLKSESLNLLEPSGPVQACNGIALPFFFYLYSYTIIPFGLNFFFSFNFTIFSANNESGRLCIKIAVHRIHNAVVLFHLYIN